MPTTTGFIDVDLNDTILYIINTISKIDKNLLIILRPHPTDNIDHIEHLKQLLDIKK